MARSRIRSMAAASPMVVALYHAGLRWKTSRRKHREYLRDRAKFEQLAGPTRQRFSINRQDDRPIYDEKTAATGFDAHYVYHVSWAARMLARTRPALHVDIASSLYFAGVASAFVPIDFYDYRPANLKLSGLQSKSGDLMNLPFANGSVASISCMHVIEHIGLGRYGEPLDPDGDLKAMKELKRVLAPDGVLLLATPIGRPRICFNAHRVYSYRMVLEQFAELKLEEFMLIPDDALERGTVENASESECDRQSYGCGCFLFRRASSIP